MVKETKKKKIEVHARSIFFQGLLLLKANELPKNLGEFVLLEKMGTLVKKNNLTPWKLV